MCCNADVDTVTALLTPFQPLKRTAPLTAEWVSLTFSYEAIRIIEKLHKRAPANAPNEPYRGCTYSHTVPNVLSFVLCAQTF